MRKGIDLAIGGWTGWTFGPWGRAREWRLHAPTGESYSAAEVADVRRLQLDIDYLRLRVRELELSQAATFTADDLATLRTAAAILQRALPVTSHDRAMSQLGRLAA